MCFFIDMERDCDIINTRMISMLIIRVYFLFNVLISYLRSDFMDCKLDEKKQALMQLVEVVKKQKNIIENRLTCEKLEIYPAQHKLLMQLAFDNSISQKELAARLQVSQATVAVSLKKLVKEGYVEKQNQEDDNRFNVITITEKGKGIIERSVKIFDNIDENMLRGFSDEEINTLFSLLKRVSNNLDDIN